MLNLVLFLVLGTNSIQRQSLHHIASGLNPYEQAISIIGKTMAEFDEDNLIPCFGFGDGTLVIS
jgi:E3 ubiquitin-protein ligase RGLG